MKLFLQGGIRLKTRLLNYADGSEKGDTSTGVPSEKTASAAKDKYAHTLFYLAQIFANIDDPRMGAYYCGETLALQLEMGGALVLT